MGKIAVCGLVNMETTAFVGSFPINYRPIDYSFFGVSSEPAGVGLNVSLALKALGDDVNLMSFCADDSAAKLIKLELSQKGISTDYIIEKNKSTAQSVVLYDSSGRRSIICDLTDNQELSYPEEKFLKASEGCDIICLCNINYAASLIPLAIKSGALIACDVHCLSDVYDEYNSRFMRAADILFLSNEAILGSEEEFSRAIMQEYKNSVIVVGMGDKGALLRTVDRDDAIILPAVYTREVKNTVGAGDSLFSAFVHFYAKTRDAEKSLKYATIFASYKIGADGGARGFLSEEKLLELVASKGV